MRFRSTSRMQRSLVRLSRAGASAAGSRPAKERSGYARMSRHRGSGLGYIGRHNTTGTRGHSSPKMPTPAAQHQRGRHAAFDGNHWPCGQLPFLELRRSLRGRVERLGIDTVTVRPTKEILLKVCASRERHRQADDDNSAKQNRAAQARMPTSPSATDDRRRIRHISARSRCPGNKRMLRL
jgi:hypothetical protein